MKKQITNLIVLAVTGSGMLACKTTHVVKVDRAKGELALYSNDDHTSAMADPAKSDTLASLSSELEENSKSPKAGVRELLNLAQIHLIRGKLDESEGAVRKVLRKDLKNRKAKLILANVFLRRGMHDMAKIILVGLGGEKSRDSKVLNLMALVALEDKDNSLAMSFFKEALRQNSSDVAVRMNLGVLYLKYRQLNEAAIQFERVLSVLPEHQDAQMHLAVIWANRGKLEEAKKVYKSILSKKEDNPVALYNYAVLQADEKEYEDAIEKLKTYIGLAKEKSQKTDKAFALINNIRQKMAVEGKKISNEEIEALAIDLETKEKRNVVRQNAEIAANAKKKETTESKQEDRKSLVAANTDQKKMNNKAATKPKDSNSKNSSSSKGLAAKPLLKKKVKTVKKAPKAKAVAEEIDDLERMLLD